MDQIHSLFKAKRYKKCLNILKISSTNSSFLENISLTNNVNVVEGTLRLLSKDHSVLVKVEEELSELLQKIRCIPVTEESLVVEVCVVCNLTVCHLVQGVCPVDRCHQLVLTTLQKGCNLVRGKEESDQFADKESRKSDLVYDLQKKMMDSNGSGPLHQSLVELCLRWASILLLNKKHEKTIQLLSLCNLESRKTQQEDLLPALLIPLEVAVLGGDTCSSESDPLEMWRLLSALSLYLGKSPGCMVHLQKLTEPAWQPYSKLMEAQFEYDAEHYLDALVVLSETAALPIEMTTRLKALHCSLFGMCLSKLNKPHSAVQKFREALDADFSYLVPLYYIATEYRKLGLAEAELESLNLLVTALQNKEVKTEPSDSIFFQHVVKRDINLTESTFYLARACEEHNKCSIASEKYIHLISLLNSKTAPMMKDSDVPSISEIYRLTIASLLKSKKYQQCEVLCDRLLSCQPTSVLDLSNILSQENSQSQTASSQTQSHSQTFVFGNNFSQSSIKEKFTEKNEDMSQGKRKRAPSNETTEPEGEGQREVVFVHLYKAEAQVCLNKIEEAIGSLDVVLEVLRNSCSSATLPLDESPSQEVKRQRLGSDGTAIPTPSTETASFWREVGQKASHVYSCLGTCLGHQNKLTDALHYLRLSQQLDKADDKTLYNCVAVLWRLDRQKEAVMMWCKGRQLDVHADSYQMASLIKRKKEAALSTLRNDLPLQVKDTMTEQEAAQLDVRCLEFLTRWRLNQSPVS